MSWKSSLLIFALMSTTFLVRSQGPVRERVKTLKVAFITERLSLTSKEAQMFWPIYNEHEEKMEAFRRKERTELRRRTLALTDVSDSEASKLLSEYQTLQENRHQAGKELIANLRGVLSSKKIILLLRAEEDFKKQLLQQFRKRRAGQ